MTRPRVLVVRSGANPFVTFGSGASVEVLETVSHTVEPLVPPMPAPDDPFDLAVFTSQVAVERVTSDPALAELRRAVERSARVAAVGPATAAALRSKGVEPSLTAEGSAEDLLSRLPERMAGSRVLHPCGEDAGTDFPDGLRRRGARVVSAVVYRKKPRLRDAAIDRDIVGRPFAAFCATSPSAARWLFEGLAEEAAARLRPTPAVVLGPFTRRYLESHGVERIVLAPDATFASALRLLEALATAPGPA